MSHSANFHSTNLRAPEKTILYVFITNKHSVKKIILILIIIIIIIIMVCLNTILTKLTVQNKGEKTYKT